MKMGLGIYALQFRFLGRYEKSWLEKVNGVICSKADHWLVFQVNNARCEYCGGPIPGNRNLRICEACRRSSLSAFRKKTRKLSKAIGMKPKKLEDANLERH